jgi:hypothetical protein
MTPFVIYIGAHRCYSVGKTRVEETPLPDPWDSETNVMVGDVWQEGVGWIVLDTDTSG